MALSKPIAQHFHCLSSTESCLNAVDIHGCGLIVCCIKNCICHAEGLGFAVPVGVGLSPGWGSEGFEAWSDPAARVLPLGE